MYFCPTCSNLLLVQSDGAQQQLYCQTCPYIYPVVKTIVQRKTLDRKQVDDVLGGDEAWANVDKTDASCPRCEHDRAYYMQIQTRSADEPMTTFYKCCDIKCGENAELLVDLNSEYRDRRKDAVKRVIANMTVGKDVSSLFPQVVKNMQTEDLEMKKLVYLYLMNYAKSNPDLVILAVNTFVKDTDHVNPLMRALAIRTMGCIRVDKILDHLCEPLRKCLQDDDPYVRKTAAICVAKLWDLDQERALENGFVTILQDLVSDSNPMVVANAVTSLAEMQESSVTKDVFVVNVAIMNKMLAALNECTEWGQIAILTSLADYKPLDSKEAENIAERVLPRLQHANGSVVLSAIKVLMIFMRYIKNEEFIKGLIKKMSPPLVSLLSSAPEVQYVSLRNINLILQKRPDILKNDVRVFFCKYNDPPYVKREKLEIIIKLCSDKNIDQILSELKEYASEVDVDFVRKAVRAIGQCAIKIDEASERCVNVLLDLINTKVNYVVQEAIIVIKDIFRKYPKRYEAIIPTLCQNLDSLDEPEARGSLIWIVGEYAEKIENADELIENFLETFLEENSQVQLQLITATVKLFLKKPSQSQEIVHRVLQTATQEIDNPDTRDRAYIYWRLLSTDPQAAKAVVLSEKPPITVVNSTISPGLMDELINNISTLASVYHKPPTAFMGNKAFSADAVKKAAAEDAKDQEQIIGDAVLETGGTSSPATPKNTVADLLDLDFGSSEPAYSSPTMSGKPAASGSNYNADLFDMSSDMSSGMTGGGAFGGLGVMNVPSPQFNVSSQPAASNTSNDPFGDLGGFGQPQQQQQQKPPTAQSSAVNDLLDLF
ncbi:beta-adaptin [Entomortierella chlamydospora]|uniref:AP complex subunit beta n=1 Tax=Entomortierella chlamydospora TaxID=101097 RepID=A0A9P6MTA4_9FUNG|nr:beta-adaptin [Entomortierella chlamydospora]